MEKREILQCLINHYSGGIKAAFAKKIGISPNGLSTWLRRDMFDADKIVANCEGVNPSFLLTGEGPITLDGSKPAPIKSPSSSATPSHYGTQINELLTISATLQSQFTALNERLAEATAIIKKSQEQFDRVLSMYENRTKTTSYMVAED